MGPTAAAETSAPDAPPAQSMARHLRLYGVATIPAADPTAKPLPRRLLDSDLRRGVRLRTRRPQPHGITQPVPPCSHAGPGPAGNEPGSPRRARSAHLADRHRERACLSTSTDADHRRHEQHTPAGGRRVGWRGHNHRGNRSRRRRPRHLRRPPRRRPRLPVQRRVLDPSCASSPTAPPRQLQRGPGHQQY